MSEIAHIRALQRQAGEHQLNREAVVLQQRERLRTDEQQAQNAREQSWKQTLDGRLDVILSGAWSHALTEGAQRLAGVEIEVAAARIQTRMASEALQAAQAKAEVADGLEKRSRLQDRRAREGRSLTELSDLFSRRSTHED